MNIKDVTLLLHDVEFG